MNDSGIQSTYIRLLPHLRLTRIYPSELSLRLGIQGRNIDFFPPVPALLIKGSLMFYLGGKLANGGVPGDLLRGQAGSCRCSLLTRRSSGLLHRRPRVSWHHDKHKLLPPATEKKIIQSSSKTGRNIGRICV